jgi:RNA polymerase sigma-70 factor (ECF subfamily)
VNARSADEVLRAIFDEHYEFVWRSLRRLGVPQPDTDDAIQQVFIIVARKLESIEPGKERQYLFGTVMRVAANARRARKKLREVPEEDAPEAPIVLPTVDARLDRAQARAVLDQILGSMADELRVVFILHVLEELPLAEVAAIVEAPQTTVVSRLRRAREEMDAAVTRLQARKQGV